MRRIGFLLVPFLLSIPATSLKAQIDFSSVPYGPFDYTNPEHVRTYLSIVEVYHFNSDVESLRATMSGGSIGSHLAYVIRSFPNHHRALISVTKLWARNDSPARPPYGLTLDQTPDFFYTRAIEFNPSDGTVRLLYGIFLLDTGRKDDAIMLFDEAAELAPDTADINYNLGLMYLRVNERKKADFHASKAYEQGHPLPGLRNKMISTGIWSE